MTDTDKILQKLELLEAGQKVLQADVSAMKVEVAKIPTLELNMEAFRAEQRAANTEIISTLHDIIEANAKETEKRFVRIEKHLDLPPVK